jgi:2'-5' RNA ligase
MPLRDTAFPSCFLAVLPSYDGSLAELCDVPDGIGFNWFRTSHLHVTLYYLGWLTDDDARAVRGILAAHLPLPLAEITLAGELSVVGEERRRSLIAPAVAVPELVAWQEGLAASLRAAGYPCAEPFRPHLTVARVGPGPLPDASMTIARLKLPLLTAGLFSGGTVLDPVTA